MPSAYSLATLTQFLNVRVLREVTNVEEPRQLSIEETHKPRRADAQLGFSVQGVGLLSLDRGGAPFPDASAVE